jgi:mannosylglycoprotein endo-beta-mannosidase
MTNQVLITLLPKRADAVEVKDFRPISIIHSVVKLVAKVLSSHLVPIMPHIVGPDQSAFIHGCLSVGLVHSLEATPPQDRCHPPET